MGARHYTLALAAVSLITLQACATLPDTKQQIAAAPVAAVTLETARGPLAQSSSQAIIDRLEAKTGASDILQKHLAYSQAQDPDSPLLAGNKLTLLQNGPETYEAMFAAMRAAKDHINLETYIFDDDAAGRKFSELLLQRQAAGVQVNLIYDSVGALATPAEFFERLKQGGVRVLQFNPVNPLAGNKKSWLINNRTHRRQLIIDGRIAFTGGINISDSYSSAPSARHSAQTSDGWRDTHLRIEGPAVAQFQKLFLETWARQKGEPLAQKNYFPTLGARGDEIVRVLGSTPEAPANPIYLTLLSAIIHAGHEVQLTIAYFAPDPQLRAALIEAAQRGVRVRLVLPSHTDSWPVFHLGRSYYSKLLKGGVEIFERRGAVMHAKTASVDGVWSTVGSTNLDSRSFLHNDELNAVILGRGFATQMQAIFAQDLKQSDAITLAQWRQRPLLDRLRERLARIAAYWL